MTAAELRALAVREAAKQVAAHYRAKAAAAAGEQEPEILRPQPGFQEQFLSSTADITIGGGAAGCGKTYAEAIVPARNRSVRGYAAVLFRRTTVQIRNPGGAWDTGKKIFPFLGAESNEQALEWRFPSGAKLKMAHLELEKTVYDWQGSEIADVIFDELTHFAASMFWYMLSRNRSTCGVRPRMWATCNPDADSWVAELIAWWIDQEESSARYGLPIAERSGVLRYFARVEDEMIWGDSPDDVHARAPQIPVEMIKSLTFIPGTLDMNKILEKADPSYRANLMALPRVERERLLGGNWKIRASAGDYFRRTEVTMLEEEPDDIVQWVRRWDLGATEPSAKNPDPDWTVGVKMGKRENGKYVVAHAEPCRKRADDVRQLVSSTADIDGIEVRVCLPQDPGQAGKAQAEDFVQELDGSDVATARETGSKEVRARPFAAQWQHGNVEVVRGPWNSWYFSQMEGFPSKGVHDDAVDASVGAYNELLNVVPEYTRSPRRHGSWRAS